MASYTMELRKVIDLYSENEVLSWFSSYNLEDFISQEKIDLINQIGIWSKEKLAKQILNHYFMREIGFETPFLFKHYVINTMNDIMPYYAELIYTSSIIYNPIENVNYHISEQRNINGNGTSNSNLSNLTKSTGSGLSINSDTPQGQISKEEILNGKYASNTNADENTSSSSNTSTSYSNGNSSSTENFNRYETGNRGLLNTNQKLIADYRKNIININLKIINELNSLFMGIF